MMESLLKMPPTATEIHAARLGMMTSEMLGKEPNPLMREVANFPIEDSSPESEWPTIGR